MLSNASFLAKIRFDTAENEPAKNLQKCTKFANFAEPNRPIENCCFFKPIFCESFEIAAVQKDANLVGLEKCCRTHIFLQNFVLIQPRTNPHLQNFANFPNLAAERQAAHRLTREENETRSFFCFRTGSPKVSRPMPA